MKFNRSIFLLFLIYLFSCNSFVPSNISMIPIDGVTPGVTTVKEIKDRSIHTDLPLYRMNNQNVWYDSNNIINKIVINFDIDKIPVNWKKLGYGKEMDFYLWLEKLKDDGFVIQVRSYPYYSQAIDSYTIKAFISAVDPQTPGILYRFNFLSEFKSKEVSDLAFIKSAEIITRDSDISFLSAEKYGKGDTEFDNDLKKQSIALSGLISGLNNEYLEKLESFDLTKPKEVLKANIVLQNIWGVSERNDIIRLLNALMYNGYSVKFFDLYSKLQRYDGSVSIMDYIFTLKLESEDLKRILFLYNFYKLPGLDRRLIYAWDWGRAIALARWGYTAGLLTEEEAWDIIYKYRNLIVSEYNSWEDFAANYILGRMFWDAGNSDVLRKVNEQLKLFEVFMHQDKNYWGDGWRILETDSIRNNYNISLNDIMYIKSKYEYSLNYYFEGLKYYNANLYNDSLVQLAEVTKFTPDFSGNNLLIGFCNRNIGNYKGELEYFTIYYNENSTDYFAGLYYGQALEHNNLLITAEEILIKTIKSKPDYHYAYKDLGRIFLHSRKFSEAEELFRNYSLYVKNDPDIAYIYYLRGAVAYEQKNYDIAVNYLQMCYFYYDKNAYINFLLGSSYLYKENKEFEKAYLYLDLARKRGYNLPENVKIFMSEWEDKHQTNPLFSPMG